MVQRMHKAQICFIIIIAYVKFQSGATDKKSPAKHSTVDTQAN